jgi:hypothetical protein
VAPVAVAVEVAVAVAMVLVVALVLAVVVAVRVLVRGAQTLMSRSGFPSLNWPRCVRLLSKA